MADGKARAIATAGLVLACLIASTPRPLLSQAWAVDLEVADESGNPLPCRIHLAGEGGKPHQPEGLPFWKGHFVCPGEAKLDLEPGKYSYLVERGPEWTRAAGVITVEAGSDRALDPIRLTRHTDLPARGWFAGDLHVHRPVEDLPLLMRAEDLHVAPVITWWRDRNFWRDRRRPENALVKLERNRFYHVMGGEDEREGGALLFFNLDRPIDITGSTREYPSPMKFLEQARGIDGAWIDIEKPFWWDVPLWLAAGKADSIGLANNHMCHSSMYESEAWGKAREVSRLPAPRGNGFWTQEIYYHILDTGIRIPPSAGSASGVLPNPLGYNRVYVHTGEKKLSYDAWWDGLGAGRSFVTNGPILLVEADGQLPGHVFRTAGRGKALEISLEISLTSLDPVPSIEIVKNGNVVATIPVERILDTPLEKTIDLSFEESGWFLVRAVTGLEHTFRFASTAPFYVEFEDEPRRISQESARFFVEWIEERIGRIPRKLEDPEKLEEVLGFQREALAWWKRRLAEANAE